MAQAHETRESGSVDSISAGWRIFHWFQSAAVIVFALSPEEFSTLTRSSQTGRSPGTTSRLGSRYR